MVIYNFLEEFISFLKGEKKTINLSDNFIALKNENGEILRKYSDVFDYYSTLKKDISDIKYKKEDSHFLLFYKANNTRFISKIKIDDRETIESIYIEKYDKEKEKIVLTITYDGSRYYGMQRQKEEVTIQGTIEDALKNMLKKDVSIISASRTDKGVHALGQVIEFDSYGITPLSYKYALNNLLPEDIRILSAKKRSQVFNARFDTVKKEYLYLVNTSKFDVFKNNYYYYHEINDIERIKIELSSLIGTHDFISFCKGEKENTIRTIYKADVVKQGSIYKFTFIGDGFLHNMIRFIVGAVLEIDKTGRGSLKEIIDSKNKKLTSKIAKAGGLYLKKIDY